MQYRQLAEKLHRAWRFAVQEDVWDMELTSLSSMRRFGVKSIRVVQLVFRGFRSDECPLHASALTFTTLMALVPVFALSLALARGLGDAETTKDWIRSRVNDWTSSFSDVTAVSVEPPAGEAAPPAPQGDTEGVSVAEEEYNGAVLAEQINGLVEDGFEKVENVSFTALGGVGLLILVWMVVAVLGKVEASFNRVWGQSRGRPLWRKFTDYLSVLFIMPVLVVAATSVPIADFATRFLDDSSGELVRSVLGSGLLKNLTVVVMASLAFSFFIMFMPNARVRPIPGLAGGFTTAVLFMAWLWLCAMLQVGAARYGKIYGSFAVVPILMAWVYVSWQIVFFGAEVAFAIQNCATYRMERGALLASVHARLTLGLSVVVAAARAMKTEGGVFDLSEFAREQRVPVRLLNDVVDQFVEAGVLGPLSSKEGAYALLRDPCDLNVNTVFGVIMRHGITPESLGLQSISQPVSGVVDKFWQGTEQAFSGVTVEGLVESSPR